MLTESQIAQFSREGYVVVPEFFDPDEVTALRLDIARLRRDGRLRNVAPQGVDSPETNGRANLQLVPIAPHSLLFRTLPFCEKVLASTSALLGDPVVKILDQLFLKPAGVGLATNWHTDNAYFRIRDPLKGAALWIAVDDASQANGTLKLIPNVFRESFGHYRDPASDHHIRMRELEADVVHCELNAGGAVFFCYGTPHATGPNPTPEDRTGVGIHFLNGAYLTRALADGKRGPYNVVMTGSETQRQDSRFARYRGRWDSVVRDIVAGAAT